MIRRILGMIFSPENMLAAALALMLVLVILFGLDTAPTWIYQGF